MWGCTAMLIGVSLVSFIVPTYVNLLTNTLKLYGYTFFSIFQTTQFFAEIPKVMDNLGYYDWVSARLKR